MRTGSGIHKGLAGHPSGPLLPRGPVVSPQPLSGSILNRGNVKELAVAAAALILTLAIFAPLFLRPGTVLLLDSPQYLLSPHPHLPPQDWGFPPGLTSQAPADALFLGLFRLLPWGPVRLLPLLLVPALAAWGFARLFRGRSLEVIAATTLYVVNPFTYERMLAGQIYFVLGYALLPLFLSVLTSASTGLGSSVAAGLLLALLVALAPHFVFIGGLLVLVLLMATLVRREWVRLWHLGTCLLVAVGASMYWLIPLSGAASGFSRVGSADLEAFRTAADPKFGLLPNVIGLYGFWRPGWPLPKDNLVGWPLFLLAILAVAAVGLAAAWRDDRLRRTAILVGLAGILALFLAMGNEGPSGALFGWLFRRVPPFRVMREPHKFLALLALAYAVLFGLGVEAVRVGATSARTRKLAVVVVLALPCLYAFRMFWGFAGYAYPSRFPSSWAQADQLMGDGTDRVLVFPWENYLPFSFTREQVVANPLRWYFRRQAIAGDTVGLGSVQPRAANPVSVYLAYLVAHGERIDDFGNLVSPLDVKYVALAKVADWRAYDWLYRQRDLRLLREWSDFALFENTRMVAPAYSPSRVVRLDGWDQVLGLADRVQLTDYAIQIRDPATRTPSVALANAGTGRTRFLSSATSSPVRYRVEASGDMLVYAQAFDAAWAYAGVRPVPNLAATNLFRGVRSEAAGSIQYVRWKQVRLGYALSGCAVALSLSIAALDRRRLALRRAIVRGEVAQC